MDGGKLRLLAVLSLAFAGLSLLAPIGAQAQQYPPPTPTDPLPTDPSPTQRPRRTPKPTCNTVSDRTVERGQNISMRGGRGCVGPRERVDLLLGSGGAQRRIGSAVSNNNGAFNVSGRIPPNTSYGKHRLTAAGQTKRYGTTIEVIRSGRGGRGNDGRRAVAVGSLLAVWVALGGVVAAFFVSRRRRRPVAAVAVGADREVPRLDTWDFVPVLPGRRGRAAAPVKKRTGSKPPRSSAKTKPKADKPKAPKATSGTSKTAKPKPPAGTGKATVTRKPSGSKAPKQPSAKAKPTRKPPKK